MYGYYFLAEMNWVDRRYGGKFITPMQLAQFLLCMAFNAAETFRLQQCGSDWRVVAYMWFTYLIFFGFFWKIYTTKREARHSDKYACYSLFLSFFIYCFYLFDFRSAFFFLFSHLSLTNYSLEDQLAPLPPPLLLAAQALLHLSFDLRPTK